VEEKEEGMRRKKKTLSVFISSWVLFPSVHERLFPLDERHTINMSILAVIEVGDYMCVV
jgi:hypothetical protein